MLFLAILLNQCKYRNYFRYNNSHDHREERGELKNPGLPDEELVVYGSYHYINGCFLITVNYIADKTGYHPKVSTVFKCNKDSDDDDDYEDYEDTDENDDNSVGVRYDIDYRKVFKLKNVGLVDKASGKSLYMPENKANKNVDLDDSLKNSLIGA